MKRMLLMISVLLFSITPAHGQAGVGKKYGTRDPFVCKSTKEPATGAPSSSQIKNYVKCKAEKTGGCCIWLMENVQVEIGKSRPFSSWSDVGNPDIDNSQPVYPIRGTYDDYQCSPPSVAGGFGLPKGQNCSVKKGALFAGICYKTTFSDWSCPVKATGDVLKGVQTNQPPPK
jgi:hypothetical protein